MTSLCLGQFFLNLFLNFEIEIKRSEIVVADVEVRRHGRGYTGFLVTFSIVSICVKLILFKGRLILLNVVN